MGVYQVMYWKDFPSQIKVTEGAHTAKSMLPDRFQQAIDAAAMADGSTGTDAYLDAWHWGPEEHRECTNPEELLHTLLHEFDATYTQAKLSEMVRAHSKKLNN
jgi:hypothetical protein